MQDMNSFTIQTNARTSFINIDEEVSAVLLREGINDGIVTVFVPHTTAGITINENADPDVLADMTNVLDELIPWTNNYRHFEGNTAAHVKASMMGSSVQLMVENGQFKRGQWQSIFFCEFDGPRTRTVWVKGITNQ